MSLFSKLKSILAIIVVFILVIATNLIDRNSFKKVKNSVDAIYHDRLVCKDLIYSISKELHAIELVLQKAPSVANYSKNVNVSWEEIKKQVISFRSTELTNRELVVLNKFQKGFEQFTYLFTPKNNSIAIEANQSQLLSLKNTLDELSDIQMAEGKRLYHRAQKEFDLVDLFTKAEIYFLIGLAVVIQIVVFYKPK